MSVLRILQPHLQELESLFLPSSFGTDVVERLCAKLFWLNPVLVDVCQVLVQDLESGYRQVLNRPLYPGLGVGRKGALCGHQHWAALGF